MINVKSGTFKNTFCVFQEIDPETINIETFDYTSQSGSSYFYTETGMYRYSNHWGRLANSKWRLIPLSIETDKKFKWGFAPWTSFYPDNAVDELYFIQPDYLNNSVNYQHKNNPDYDNKAILRTSFETTKRIKQARNILTLTSWAKYFDFDAIDDLRKTIVEQLIYTNKTLDEIKREL